MSKKNILVNATSATMGGTLSILNQFINNIARSNRKEIYYIFVPLGYVEILKRDNIKIIRVDAKSYLKRIIWDYKGIKKWTNKFNVTASLVISLQNTAVRMKNTKQIVYLHQSIQYFKNINWSPFKADERKLWFYKNIYKYVIKLTIKKDMFIIVQTDWMKSELIKDGYSERNIIVAKPSIRNIDKEKVESRKKSYKYIFYPAADYKYKNHEVLIESVKQLLKKGRDLREFKIIFTLSKESKIYSKIKEERLTNYFEFIDIIPYEEVLKLYKGCEFVIFPSYIETIGLPLIEAGQFGKKILVSDCKYSREVLKNYKNCKFIKYNDVDKWAYYIENSMKCLENDSKEVYENIDENDWEKVFKSISNILEKED